MRVLKQRVVICPTSSNSPLFFTSLGFEEQAQRVFSFFNVAQSALILRGQSSEISTVIKIDISDPLAVEWSLVISKNEIGLLRKSIDEYGFPKDKIVNISDSKFKDLCAELALSMPNLNTLKSKIDKIIVGETDSNSSYKEERRELFIPMRVYNEVSFNKLSSRRFIDSCIKLGRVNLFRQPKFGVGKQYRNYQELKRDLGNKIYGKRLDECSGAGQFVIQLEQGKLKISASDLETVHKLSEHGGIQFNSSLLAVVTEDNINKILLSGIFKDYIFESAITGTNIHGFEYEFRYIVASNSKGNIAKVVGTWARRKTIDSLWCNVSKGAKPMYLADAMFEVSQFFAETQDADSREQFLRSSILELTSEAEKLSGIILENVNRLRPFCLDFVPYFDTKNRRLQYYIMEFQIPENGTTIGIEQFGNIGIVRRSTHDGHYRNFGDIPRQ